jgi:hypothetical protein
MGKMKHKITIVIILLIAFVLIYCKNIAISNLDNVSNNYDSAIAALLIPESYYLEVEKQKDHFITRMFKIYNKGKSQLTIYKVESSCGCSNATVLNSRILPLDSGSFYVSINLLGLYDERNVVEFKILSNAINSPTIFKIKISVPENQDTLKIKED